MPWFSLLPGFSLETRQVSKQAYAKSSTICVRYNGHVRCTRGGGTFVYLLHPRRDGYGQALSLYTFDNVNYVSWRIVHRASVIMLEVHECKH